MKVTKRRATPATSSWKAYGVCHATPVTSRAASLWSASTRPAPRGRQVQVSTSVASWNWVDEYFPRNGRHETGARWNPLDFSFVVVSAGRIETTPRWWCRSNVFHSSLASLSLQSQDSGRHSIDDDAASVANTSISSISRVRMTTPSSDGLVLENNPVHPSIRNVCSMHVAPGAVRVSGTGEERSRDPSPPVRCGQHAADCQRGGNVAAIHNWWSESQWSMNATLNRDRRPQRIALISAIDWRSFMFQGRRQ